MNCDFTFVFISRSRLGKSIQTNYPDAPRVAAAKTFDARVAWLIDSPARTVHHGGVPDRIEGTVMSAKKAMPAKEPRVNKSELIREALKQLGSDAAPKDVIRLLGGRNVRVSPAQVSNVKAMLKRSEPGRSPRGGISVDDLMEAKKLADRLGGIKNAIRALEALSRLC